MSGGRKRGQIEASRERLKEIQKKLRERKRAQGLKPGATATLPNRVSDYESVSEEKQARLEALTEQVNILRENFRFCCNDCAVYQIPGTRGRSSTSSLV